MKHGTRRADPHWMTDDGGVAWKKAGETRIWSQGGPVPGIARNCRESPGSANERLVGGLPLGAAQDRGASDDCVWKGVQTAGRGRRTLLSQVLNVLHGRGCTSDAALLYCTDTPGRLARFRLALHKPSWIHGP